MTGVRKKRNQFICKALLYGIIIGNILFIIMGFITQNNKLINNTSSIMNTIQINNELSIKQNKHLNMPNYNIKISDKNDIFNDEYNNDDITLRNRKLRRPASKDCHLPPGFPGGPPGYKRMKRICGNLKKFSILCPESKKCIDCIPPWGGDNKNVMTMTKQFIKSENKSRVKRREELAHIIKHYIKLKHDESSILIMTLNYGYAHLFLNWLCGLHLRGIAHDIRETTIIIATDKDAFKLAKKLGFQAVTTTWLSEEGIKVDTKAARQFALGPHRWVVTLQIVYTFDLIHMGYNVITQDADVIWLKDVRKYFENTFLDIEMVCDGRLDSIGPGNSGFIHLRSNCKTKIYMETIMHYIGLVISGRSDQRVWNMILTSYDFRQMHFEMLPPDKFFGGHQWGNGRKRGDQLSKDIWFMHASWTLNHNGKITKFEMLDYWFLNQTCQFYGMAKIPDSFEPAYYHLHEHRNWSWPDPNQKVWWI